LSEWFKLGGRLCTLLPCLWSNNRWL